jgi:hypothetical protein
VLVDRAAPGVLVTPAGPGAFNHLGWIA